LFVFIIFVFSSLVFSLFNACDYDADFSDCANHDYAQRNRVNIQAKTLRPKKAKPRTNSQIGFVNSLTLKTFSISF